MHVAHRAPLRARIVAVLVVGLVPVALAACSKSDSTTKPDSSKPELEQIRDATVAAGSAKYSGEVHGAAGEGTIEGITQADPAVGDVTFPFATPTGSQDVEAVWIDGKFSVRRVTTTDPNPNSTFLRLENELPWVEAPQQPLTEVQIAPYEPFSLLDLLAGGAAPAVPDGSESVEGKTLDRFTVDLSSVTVAPVGATRVELLTNSAKRLEMVRLSGPTTISYQLTDFGVSVTVSPPPEDQIARTPRASTLQPAGPFELMAQGTSGGVAWSLYRAPASDGGTCWRLDTDQPLDPVAATQPDGATCVSASAADAPADQQVDIVADAGPGANFDAIVATMPAGSQAKLFFVDRSSQALSVDPRGFAVWIGPKSPLAVVLQVSTPDGSQTSCGPGSVSELEDLDSMTPDAVSQLDRAPWLCV